MQLYLQALWVFLRVIIVSESCDSDGIRNLKDNNDL
jgi:hypothetical protein